MPLEIIRNDITKVKADAIVNTANPKVGYGPGVDSAIYEAAGADDLLKERAKIGDMAPGTAAITPAFNLDAKYIIHTVGPYWTNGHHGEPEAVTKCYKQSLALAKKSSCESVAFPLLSTGNNGFPKDLALSIAIKEISTFLLENEMMVYIVVYDKEVFELSTRIFNDIAEYIDDDDVRPKYPSELNLYYLDADKRPRRRFGRWYGRPAQGMAGSSLIALEEKAPIDTVAFDTSVLSSPYKPDFYEEERMSDSEDDSIDILVRNKDLTFQEHLFRLIDKKGLEDVEVYKKANIDRKHFSKIKSNVNYNPSKKTALAFAIALGLNLDETKDLLLRAGIALSPSSTFDIIVEYCIEHRVTDINEINCILFKYDQPILGA